MVVILEIIEFTYVFNFVETLALKGLFLLFLDKRNEGFDTCKRGLKLSLQSHICTNKFGPF